MPDASGGPPPSVSEKLAAWACGLSFGSIPPQVVQTLKGVVLHDLVMGLIARTDWQAAQAMAFIRGEAGAPGCCTVIGHADRASPIDAAHANAVMLRALRQEDTLMPSGIHAVAITLPVALALAEQRGRSGAELLAAIVVGCEVAAALDRAAPEKRIIRTASHTYGGFAAAVTAGRLLGLEEAGMAMAIGYAANLAVTVQAGYEDHQYGLLARLGMIAAYMAESGAPAPRDAIEGDPGFFQSQLGGPPDSFEPALAALDRDYALLGVVLKPFPGALNSGVGALILGGMMAEHRFAAGDVAGITMSRVAESNDALKHAFGPFRDRSAASSSMPFALAATLLDGGLRLARLDAPNDADLLRLAGLVDFADLAGEARRGYHRIEVRTHAGATLVGEGDYRLLSVPAPAELTRFHGAGPSEDEVVRLTAAVSGLERDGGVAGLAACLGPPA